MSELIALVGFFLAIEGALYAGAPGFLKRMAKDVSEMEEHVLRRFGLASLAVGFLIVWLVKSAA